MASVEKQCLDSIVNVTRQLSLTGVAPDEIAARRRPRKGDAPYYGITFFLLPEQETRGTNQRDDVGYAIGCLIAVHADQSLSDGIDLIPSWRESIRREFIHQRLPEVSLPAGCYLTTTIEPGNFLTPKDERYEFSQFVIRCWMRESRT